MHRFLTISVILALSLAAAGPASADAFKPSKTDQVKLGKRAADDLRHREKILPNSDERVRMLRRVAARLLATVHDGKDPWEYSFDVIQSKQVNAFALPGGPTFFFTGLLDKMATEDELAGVMAHELTHVRKEHWAYAYADDQKRNLLLNIGLIILKANRNAADLASISNDLLFSLPFSRKHETEADDGGFEMMIKAGYNPQGLADSFKLLDRLVKGGAPPEFLSDHPADKNRITRIEKKVTDLNRTFPAQRPLPWAPRVEQMGIERWGMGFRS